MCTRTFPSSPFSKIRVVLLDQKLRPSPGLLKTWFLGPVQSNSPWRPTAHLPLLARCSPVASVPRRTQAFSKQLARLGGRMHSEVASGGSALFLPPWDCPCQHWAPVPLPFHVRVHGYARALCVLSTAYVGLISETKLARTQSPDPCLPSFLQVQTTDGWGSHSSQVRALHSQGECVLGKRVLVRNLVLTLLMAPIISVFPTHHPPPQTPLLILPGQTF